MRPGARRPAASAVAIVALLLLSMAAPAGARAAAGGVRVTATVDGRPVGASTEARPIRLSPRHQASLAIEVVNGTSKPLDVRIVRIEGKVVGLTFFAYDTAVGLKVAPGGTGSRRFLLDLGGLDGQATGLIPGAVKLLDADRHVVAAEGGVIDVRGSLRSVYGIFGVGVAFLTLLSFLGALVGLARHRLPPNRWRRALRFLTPGIGLGLSLNFTLSATRVFVPTPGRWLTILVVSAAVLFGVGYLTPAPDTGDDEDEDEELIGLPGPPVRSELPAPPVKSELPGPVVQHELPAPAVQPELPVPAPRAELATPEGVPALAAVPSEPDPATSSAGPVPAIPSSRSELVTPDQVMVLPEDVEPEAAAGEAEPHPAPPTVAVPGVPPAAQ